MIFPTSVTECCITITVRGQYLNVVQNSSVCMVLLRKHIHPLRYTGDDIGFNVDNSTGMFTWLFMYVFKRKSFICH